MKDPAPSRMLLAASMLIACSLLLAGCTSGPSPGMPDSGPSPLLPPSPMATGVSPSGTINVTSGFALCNGLFMKVLSDRNNCGSCGHVCGPGESCQGGRCVWLYFGTPAPTISPRYPFLPLTPATPASATGPVCTTGFSVCNDSCVNLGSDPRNCGSCGKKCPMGYDACLIQPSDGKAKCLRTSPLGYGSVPQIVNPS